MPPTLASSAALFHRLLSRLVQSEGRAGIARAAALTTLGALSNGFGLLMLLPILQVLISGPMTGTVGHLLARLGFTDALSQLHVLLLVFLGTIVGQACLVHARDRYLAGMQARHSDAMRALVLGAVAEADWREIAGLRHAAVESLIANDVPRISMATHHLLKTVVGGGVVLVNGVVMLVLAPQLMPVLVVVGLLCLVLVALSQRQLRRLGAQLHGSAQNMTAGAKAMLSGLKAARAENAQGWFMNRFRSVQERVTASLLAYQKAQSDTHRAFTIASAMIAITGIYAGVWLDVAPATLIALTVIIGRVAGPALMVLQAVQGLLFTLPSLGALERHLAQLHTGRPSAPTGKRRLTGDLELRGVSYRHPGGSGIAHIDFSLRPGEWVGISGPSGAGKTTLLDVICGLLRPDTGTIRVGGTTLDDTTRPAWQAGIGYVTQSPFLFADSVRANLAWQDLPCEEEHVWQVLELVGADGLVSRLPDGLDTMIGENGALLSGGEKQRLALARALLRAPFLLILDEATSALDEDSEARIFERLSRISPRPMLLLVAHRQGSLAHCDRVVCLEPQAGPLRDGSGAVGVTDARSSLLT